ncbi:MAG: PqqD family protein [Rhodospirillales bacterium]|nr:MAG: PqqD family protein [Rhodospirillales bacterium]
MPRYRRAPDIVATTLDDGTFLVDPATQDIFHLDALGGGVWNALADPESRDDLLALLREAFPDIDPAVVAADLDALLADLSARGLVAVA